MYNDSVLPGEDSKLVQAGDKIPARSDVAGEKDAKSEDRDWVHRTMSSLMFQVRFFVCVGG